MKWTKAKLTPRRSRKAPHGAFPFRRRVRPSAAVELDGGDPAHAAEQALAPAAAADRAGAPVEAALSRLLAGRALMQADDRERAAAKLQRAAHDFREPGALRYCGEAERELRKLGHRIQQRTLPGGPAGTTLESLTEREL
jgi:hypothetical protein